MVQRVPVNLRSTILFFEENKFRTNIIMSDNDMLQEITIFMNIPSKSTNLSWNNSIIGKLLDVVYYFLHTWYNWYYYRPIILHERKKLRKL